MRLPWIVACATAAWLALALPVQAGTSRTGRISFSGAVVSPTCAIPAVSARPDPTPQACPLTGPHAAAMTTRYTTTTRTLGWHEPDRLLRYLVQRNAGAGDAQGTQSTLITVTYL